MANLLKRQGFYNSIILYAGTALGFLNLAVLFQRFLTTEQIGFFSLMIALSLLYTQLASVGISNIIPKYFPYYRSDDKKHGGFVTFVLIWCAIGFFTLTVFFILFKDSVIAHYRNEKGSSLLVKYYYYLVPVSFLTTIYAALESMGSTVFKNVLSSFLREVVLRAFTLISILLIAFSLINYQDFLMIYIVANVIMVIVLWRYIYKGKDFKLAPVSKKLMQNKNTFIKYGIFTVLSSSSFVLIQNLDIIMLTTITKNLALVGIYTTFFAIAVVISLPAKALSRTSLQIISQSWAENDLAKISKIYYKTSVVQMLIGCLLFIGLIINRPFVMWVLHKPIYANYFDVFIVVGLAFLVDMTGGINGYILNVSKYYKWTTYIIGFSVLVCGAANWILIPRMGIMGAAVAYLLTMFLLNFMYWIFLKIKFGLQPFGKIHFLVLLISLITFCAGWFMPAFSNFWVDMIVRSGIVGLIYITMAYFLNISEDINQVINKILKIKQVPHVK
jgi:O-antigen/teichoic acid export membrane protein